MKRTYYFLLLCVVSYGYAQKTSLMVDHTKEIVFGQSGGFTGHFKYYGTAIRDAILACFEHINKSGGIKGKKLRLISLDDQSDSEITKKNIEMLYHTYGITMFIGVMGTRGVLSVLPLVKEKKIALYFPWASSQELRDPQLTNMVNSFGLLDPQIDHLIDHITNTLKITNIAIFHADDDLSKNAAEYGKKKVAKVHNDPVAMASYNRFTMNIEKPAQLLMDADPRAVICIATSIPMVKLINQFFTKGFFGTLFYGVDSTFLAKDVLRSQGSFVHYASSVPDPNTSTIPLAQHYRDQLTHYNAHADYSVLSFAYYASTRILCQALQNITLPANNTSIITYLESLKNTQIEGFSINFDPKNRYIFGDKTWLI